MANTRAEAKFPFILPDWTQNLARDLAQVRGIAGVVLGGSRARGNAKPDSDFDIGIYYSAKDFDWDGIRAVARKYDDTGDPQGMAPPGEWGPWINGGAWLSIQKNRVDLLLRDYDFVSQVVSDCEQGKFSIHYQIGHPNAFYSSILMAEAALCRPIADLRGEVAALQARTRPYPVALKRAVFQKFSFESDFTLGLIAKLKDRDDPYYLQGLVFRFTSCLIQLLFAVNEEYFMNEKGSVDAIRGFSKVPPEFYDRMHQICSSLPVVGHRTHWIEELQALFADVKKICQ